MDLVESLKKVLATTFVLYTKTHSFHWNVTGGDFAQLHELFGNQYEEIWEAIDVIAESIRTLKAFAPGSLDGFRQLSSVADTDGVPQSSIMVQILEKDHEALCDVISEAFELADEQNDQAIMNMLADRLEAHKKHAWMLRAISGVEHDESVAVSTVKDAIMKHIENPQIPAVPNLFGSDDNSELTAILKNAGLVVHAV